MMAATKKGRPRKEGEREPNGRIQRRLTSEGAARDRIIIKRARLDEYYGSPVGVLFLHEKITAAEYAAAKEYRSKRAKVDQLLGLPRRHPASPDIDRLATPSGGSAPPLSRGDRAVVAALDVADRALGHRRPGGLWWIVDQVVVHEIAYVGHQQFLTLRAALQALVACWDIRS